MKQNYFTLIIAFAVILIMNLPSCKKDKLTDPAIKEIDESCSYDSKTARVVQSIKNFDNRLSLVKQGICRHDSYMEVDSAIWCIESLFNATYSFPEKKYVDKSVKELSFEIEAYNDKLSMKDINALYENIKSSVKDVYINDGFVSDKGLMSIFVQKGENRSGKIDVKVVVVTGRCADYDIDLVPILYGPFKDGSCWYYGEYGGSCEDPNIIADAAELLEDTINYYHGYKPPVTKGTRNIFVNMLSVALQGNEFWSDVTNDYYIYYKVNCDLADLYLDVNDLNRYYYNEVNVIKNLVPGLPECSSIMQEDHVFIEVNIDGIKGYDVNDFENVVYMHNNYIFYGIPYEVKMGEFGERKDLLNS